VGHDFEQLLGAEIRLVESLADTVKEVASGTASLKHARALVVADRVVGGDHRLPFGVGYFVEASDDGGHEIRAKSGEEGD